MKEEERDGWWTERTDGKAEMSDVSETGDSDRRTNYTNTWVKSSRMVGLQLKADLTLPFSRRTSESFCSRNDKNNF